MSVETISIHVSAQTIIVLGGGFVIGALCGYQAAVLAVKRLMKQRYLVTPEFTRYTKNTTVDDFKK